MAHNRATVAFVKKLAEAGLVKPLRPEQLSTFKKFSFDNSKFNQYGMFGKKSYWVIIWFWFDLNFI